MRDNSFVQFTFRNVGWIASSVFLALVVWVAATMSNNPIEQRELNRIPVKVVLPDGYVLSQPTPSLMARAVIRTQQSEWDLLVADDVQITADLSNIREPGEYRVELDASIASPRHGRVIAIQPSSLTFTVDQEAEKRVPVRAIVVEDPPPGYALTTNPTCEPSEVTVSGSADRVQSVDHVEVRLSLGDTLNPGIKENQPAIPLQKNGREVRGTLTIDPETVDCSVEVNAREDVIQMRVLPNVVGDPPSGYLFEGYANVSPELVGVTGNQLVISSMNGIVRTKAIDLSSHTETFTVEVPANLPAGVQLVPDNQIITVTVRISALPSSRQLEEVPVEITGLDTTMYRATGMAKTVTVIVVGPQAVLPDRQDVTVTVDLSGLQPGNHQVKPQVNIANQGNGASPLTISVLPEELNVTIDALNPTPTPSPTPTVEAGESQTVTPSPATSTPTPPSG